MICYMSVRVCSVSLRNGNFNIFTYINPHNYTFVFRKIEARWEEIEIYTALSAKEIAKGTTVYILVENILGWGGVHVQL
jgi:hypothetical protein